MQSEIKPCPFCGCNRIGIECSEGGPALRKLTYNARCNNCMASCAGYGTRELAVKYWNTRTPSPADEMVRGLEREPVTQALAMLHSMIDGGEECRGRDSEISDIIRLLEQGR